jgi:hypothetical protein
MRFGSAGVVKVASHLYPAATTYVECFTYDDQAPILVIHDGHVEVTITTPDSGQVTDQDLTWGRALVEVAARYVAELERRQAAHGDGSAAPAHPADQADWAA